MKIKDKLKSNHSLFLRVLKNKMVKEDIVQWEGLSRPPYHRKTEQIAIPWKGLAGYYSIEVDQTP